MEKNENRIFKTQNIVRNGVTFPREPELWSWVLPIPK